MERSSASFRDISAPRLPLWSRSLLVTAFYDIYEISVLVLHRDPFIASQNRIAASHHKCNYLRACELPERSPCHVFSDTAWPRRAWSPMTAGRPHFLCVMSALVAVRGQPRGGLTLVYVFSLAPCQEKENTWSWSPVLSADIFGKGCWIQVCVWSCASSSQVKHRETQRLLHFSV